MLAAADGLWYAIAMQYSIPFLAWAIPCAAMALTLETVCEIDRPPEPESLSSLAFVSNDVYWASTDWRPKMYELTVRRAADGKPNGVSIALKCPLEGAKDVEGLAYDPLRGTFWAADEVNMTVCEYDPATGRRLGALEVPAIFSQRRLTYGFESLCIRADGLEMWLANEEALKCDGAVSTSKGGTTVRLARFVRADAKSAWRAAGQWAYVTDALAGSAPLDSCRSGLTGLCMLEDGTLLALEREYSFKPLPALRCRIYAVDRTGATDVTPIQSLAPGGDAFTPVAKQRLFDAATGLSMYEGIAAGPVAPDGSRLIYLVSDGDKMMSKRLLVLRLTK